MWYELKDVLYTIGSIAGVTALVRPVLEQRMARDQSRIQKVFALLNEQDLLNLEYCVWHSRWIPDSTFAKLASVRYGLADNVDDFRFSGPAAKYLSSALSDVVSSYERLRELVQVPEWEPVERDGEQYWSFNKRAFENERGLPEKYAEHLHEAARLAKEIALAFQRFQIVSELHMLEVPIARLLLRRRISAAAKRNA